MSNALYLTIVTFFGLSLVLPLALMLYGIGIGSNEAVAFGGLFFSIAAGFVVPFIFCVLRVEA